MSSVHVMHFVITSCFLRYRRGFFFGVGWYLNMSMRW